MPDPRDPTPVKVVARGGKFVIVDASGDALAEGDSYDDVAKAKAAAATINSSWDDAKSERKAKGGPAITEARVAEILELDEGVGGIGKLTKFNPALHPHDRQGEFAAHLNGMAVAAKVELPSGVHIRRGAGLDNKPGQFNVHDPYLGDVIGHHVTAEGAARQALMVHDAVSKGARLVDKKSGKTVARYPSKAEAHRHKKPEHKVEGMMEESVISLRGRSGATVHELGGRRFGPYNPALHPHGTRGHFATTLHAAASRGEGVELPSGVRVHQSGTFHKHYVVTHPDLTSHVEHNEHAAADSALTLHRSLTPARQRRHEPSQATFGHGNIEGIRKHMADDDARRASSEEHRRWRMEEGVALDENAVSAVLHSGPTIHLRFDPRLHRRDRAGKFAETLGRVQRNGHGSSVELPHGVKVENHLGKLRVHSPYGVSRFSTPHAAAAVAIAGVDQAEVERGGDPDAHFTARMDELEGARRKAMSTDLRDVEGVEGVMRQVRLGRSSRQQGSTPIPSRKGRSLQSRTAYAGARTGDVHRTMMTLDRMHREDAAALHLPPPSEEADAIRPSMDAAKLRVVTGYGEYAAKPNPGAQNIYDLHRAGSRLTVLGTSHNARAALAAIHDEAMQRHVAAKAEARAQVVRDILKA